MENKEGVKSSRTLKNGQVIIESSNKEEAEIICHKINEKCGEELEAVTNKKLNPRIIIFNVGDEIRLGNAADALTSQNACLYSNKQDVKPIFEFLDRKKNRNLIVEISSTVRNQILGKKLKFSWNMCTWDDYIKVSHCFKCSKYNHRAQKCTGKLVVVVSNG